MLCISGTFSHKGRRKRAASIDAKNQTFLMFDGKCEEAMRFYVSLFKDAAVTGIRRYGAGEAGAEGSVMQATFTIVAAQLA
jgi:predicted 3-demethylubiquinone-9 3-methyltransferase (glyoxalase superfamily)